MVDTIGPYGSGEYGSGPYGSAFPPYGLESATSLGPTLVRVRYTTLFDEVFPPLLTPANYSIFPALTVHSVIQETAQTVILITDPQTDVLYTVTVDQARGYFGQPLDPLLDSATFLGFPVSPTFFAVATRKTRVRAVFTEAMFQNAALTDPSEYILTDLSLDPITVSSVQAEQSTDVRSVVLTLGEDLVDERHYQLTIGSGVVTATGKPLSPSTDIFQWVENTLRTQIPVEQFSGEVQTGLYGIHGGLVFFSPALETAAANSIIQVDDVHVCTKAYDEYHFPEPIDPYVLHTHGAGVVPTTRVTTLNNVDDVLWAAFPRLVDATITLEDRQSDTVVPPVDGPCDATVREIWDLSYVSLQNSDAWKIFDNGATPPEYFITAKNLAPIPPGAVVTINLQP